MNNFIKRLSQREIGFIYLLSGLIVWFGFPFLTKFISSLSFLLVYIQIISPIISIVSILLFIAGVKKISSSNKDLINNINPVKKIKLIEPLLWIIIGLISATFIFWLPGCKTGEVCHWDIMLALLFVFLIPSIIFGISAIFIGVVKLNKYLKYIKLQKQNTSEEVK